MLVALLLAAAPAAPVAAGAEKAKTKPKAAAAKAAPLASAEEINKMKGDFKWGMTLEEVTAKVAERIEAGYAERLQRTANDPTGQDRVRKEMRADVQSIGKNFVKFEGPKSGYDVSIIDQEFTQKTSESLLVAKEPNSTRYFFFAYEKLYKMFVAFDKDMLNGKSFPEFGGLMQARFGKAREVFVEQKTKAGVKKKLDYYTWGSKTGDVLRLVDRSEFYDVYCLVLSDGQVDKLLADARKANPTAVRGLDPVVEAVTAAPVNDRDSNDNVIARITGKKIHKPGDDQDTQNIVVPSPTAGVRAPSAAEVNGRDAGGGGKGRKSGKAASTTEPSHKGLEL